MDAKERIQTLASLARSFKQLDDKAESLEGSLSIERGRVAGVLVYSGLNELAEAVGATIQHEPINSDFHSQKDSFMYEGVLFFDFSSESREAQDDE